MPSYLVETYLPRGAAHERPAQEQRARSAAADLTRRGRRVRLEHSIHIPQDETCFFVFEAPSADVAVLVAEHAALQAVRIVEAVTSGKEHQ